MLFTKTYNRFNELKTFLLSSPPQETKNSRSLQVDIVKGIAILLVVAGHAKFSLSLWWNQYAFHMQLFFIVAGFFINFNSSLAAFIFQKIKALLVPFYVYLLFFAGLTYMLVHTGFPFYGYGKVSDIFSWKAFLIKPYLHNHHIFLFLPMWFVSTLFQVMLLVAVTRPLLRFFSKNYLRITAALLFCLLTAQVTILYAKPITDFFDTGWLTRLIIVYGLVAGGFFLWKLKELWNRTSVLATAVILHLVLAWNYNPEYTMSWNNYGQGMLPRIFIPVSLCGTAAIFAIARVFEQMHMTGKFLAFCGKKSFHIMALHLMWIFLISLTADIICKKDLTKLGFFNWSSAVAPALLFAGSLALSLLSCCLIDLLRNTFLKFSSKSR